MKATLVQVTRSHSSTLLALWFFITAGYVPILNGQEATSDQAKFSSQPIDVATQIWPIFRNRCLRCHGPTQTDGKELGGGFRIDTIEGIRAGGHTSNSILGRENEVDNSELMRRLISEDEQYRMPKDEIPLPKSQVKLIRKWVEEGASWPDGGVLEIQPEIIERTHATGSHERTKSSAEEWLDFASDIHSKVSVVLIPLVLFLAVMLLLERRKKQLQPRSAERQLTRFDRVALAATGMHYLCGYMLIVLFAGVLYHVRRIDDMQRALESTEAKLGDNRDPQSNAPNVLVNAIPEPYRPKHPRRLGGEYYRGNDERSEQLFNGGYYRTATMRLSLRDQDDRSLAWDDTLETDRCFVHIEIEKAPFTTSELFNSRIFESCMLSRAIPGVSTSQFDEPPVYFNSTESTDRWFASYEIVDFSESIQVVDAAALESDEHVSGLIYLYNNGTAHFGIRYDVHFRDRQVTKDSELWMGAILLPGNAIVPENNSITLTEWFDFLPIPEITEPNTYDPVLLGIPEHQQE